MSAIVTDVDRTEPLLYQRVRVNFVPYVAGDVRVLQAFSGKPGYLKGYPVLVGGMWW